MKERQQSIGRGFLVLSLASILVKLMSLVFVPVMRHLLGGDVGYGVFGATNEVFAFVYVLTTAGLPVAVSKLVTELTATHHKREAEQSFRLARSCLFLIGLMFTAVMAVFAKPIAALMNNEESWLGMLFIAPNLLICSVLSAYRGYFQGKKNMTPTALSQIAEQVVHVLISVFMVVLLRSRGIVWAVAGASMGTVAGSLVALIIVLLYYKRYRRDAKASLRKERAQAEAVLWKRQGVTGLYGSSEGSDQPSRPKEVRRITTKELLKRLAYYSIPITLSAGVQYGGNLVDASILTRRLEVSGLDVVTSRGWYGVMMATRQLINVPSSLITALCVSILPALAAAYALRNRRETSEKANYGFRLCYLVAFPLGVAMTAFAQPIYTLLRFGDNYVILMSMSLSIVLLGTVHLQGSILQGVNRMYLSTIFLSLSVVLKAVLNYVLIPIPALRIYGAVLSTYLSYLIPLILNHIVLNRVCRLRISLIRNAWRPAFCSVLMLVCAIPVYFGLHALFVCFMGSYLSILLAFLPTVCVGAAAYAISMRKIGGLTDEDLDSVSPKLTRIVGRLERRLGRS